MDTQSPLDGQLTTPAPKIRYVRLRRSNRSYMTFDFESVRSVTRAHLEEMSEAEPLVSRWAGWHGFLCDILSAEDVASLSTVVSVQLAMPAFRNLVTDSSWLELPAWLAPSVP